VALDYANLVRKDVTYAYTQADVDAADATLVAVMDALIHDHPVLAQIPVGGVTEFRQAVTVKIKGYLPDVASLEFAGRTYTLVPTGDSANPAFDILDGSVPVGTITYGSATVSFDAGFMDTLENGTYELRLGFNDHYELLGGASFTRSGVGIAEVIINRPPAPSGTVPKTGDGSLPLAVLGVVLLVAGGLVLGVGVAWRPLRRRVG
jgi:LPXTG-motif cell wall-anchored protein